MVNIIPKQLEAEYSPSAQAGKVLLVISSFALLSPSEGRVCACVCVCVCVFLRACVYYSD